MIEDRARLPAESEARSMSQREIRPAAEDRQQTSPSTASGEAPLEQRTESRGGGRSGRRYVVALASYALLLGLAYFTLPDRRIRAMTVSVLVLFLGLTLLQARREARNGPAGEGRAAEPSPRG